MSCFNHAQSTKSVCMHCLEIRVTHTQEMIHRIERRLFGQEDDQRRHREADLAEKLNQRRPDETHLKESTCASTISCHD